ncbi:MAG: hypothetical protein KGL39_07720 [Patescibacteria group bacterium]|nr:hypothetical protein [Patescibacteria group bacterium]
MQGQLRCVEGRLLRHDRQLDDPDLETDIGVCPECEGRGRNCDDCGASHAEETWDIPIPPYHEHYCTRCADQRRDHWLERH